MRGHGHGHSFGHSLGHGFGHGYYGRPYGWGMPMLRPWGLCGGLFSWLILGALGFLLGRNYMATAAPTPDRETALAQREAEVRRREEAIRQQERPIDVTVR